MFKSNNTIATYFIVLLAFIIIFICFPFQANAQVEKRSYLTLEMLQDRSDNLIVQAGRDTIDLSNYIIDFSNVDSDYNQQFYQKINDAIVRHSQPVSLNFSNSIIQGYFQLNQLGITSSVSEGTLSSIFNPLEQEKINQYYPLSNNIEDQIAKINIFRGSLNFDNAIFTGEVDASDSLFLQQLTATSAKFQNTVKYDHVFFGREVDFSQSIFSKNTNFHRCHFFAKAKFRQIEFQGINDFSNSQFEDLIEFNDSIFYQLADFTRSVFIHVANFSNTIYRDRLIFFKSKFLDSLLFINTTFEKTITFRDIYTNSLINLQDAHLLDRVDFSNAFFTLQAKINTSGLAFDSAEAKIIGDSSIIGKYIQVDRLEGNETVFRNLIRNFRSLEQIADANRIEYQREKLRAIQLGDRLTKIAWQKIFTWGWLRLIPQWLILNLLLLLGDYGTNINSLFSIGMMAIAFFSFLLWLVDRYRPHISQPVIPSRYEIMIMVSSYLTLTAMGIVNILLVTDRPWLTLLGVTMILFLIPILITGLIYRRGRYHNLLNTTYFVEDGSLREFRLLIGRLPIMPRFPFYRDRYQPLMWQKRWSWLNYYDFSLNNIFKLGFNDIRLRDRHLPGLISTLVWYQWCLGVLYVILLLWTLSRTIPGLNLLIYF